ncbi:hypothetical protein IQ07DRAFT_424599 [Pyrenochaeta sp. DS3sAY3a]|nr:hypothetical protein IQ07DRAFT_424599 [Pyrenochaeta sp. DS3sAY3a]
MPPTMHPHLKRGLDFDEYHSNPTSTANSFDSGPEENHDPAQQAAKRRRIELIAAQYLKGRPPLILSARLKGPFDHGWRNPWKTQPQKERACSGHGSRTADGRKQPGGGPKVKSKKNINSRSGIMHEVPLGYCTLQTTSPEASRAADGSLSAHSECQDDSLDNIEVPQATAPSPVAHDVSMGAEIPSSVQLQHQNDSPNTLEGILEEQERSGATPFFSANAEPDSRRSSRNASSTNNSWLKRAGHRERSLRANTASDLSPTRTRSIEKPMQRSTTKYLNLVRRDAASHTMSAPAKTTGEPGATSDSIDSEIVPNNTLKSRRSPEAAVEDPDPASPCALPITIAEVGPVECIGTHRDTSKVEPSQTISSSAGERQLSREDVQQSAERLVGIMNSSRSTRQVRRASQEAPQNTSRIPKPRHDLVASPAPASSTGFVYRKIGTVKRTANTRRKVRAIDFDTSPTSRPDNIAPTAQSPKESNVDVQTGSIEEVMGETAESEKGGQKVPQDSPSYSTQAAMLLAQKEIQEDSIPSVMSSTLRHESQPQTDTPRPMLADRSAAITPFSVRLDKPISHQSVRQDIHMSTQELFSAASPFAFSTVKKQPGALQQSDLRRVLLSGNDKHHSINTKSPTPSADRVPLKTKNTTTLRWSFVSGKTSQASQESLDDRPRRSMSEVELPRLDLDTSLGDFGRTAGLDFMDGLMHNLGDT